MKTIVLATRNKNKVRELMEMLDGVKLLSLDDIGFVGEIEENGTTLPQNASIKANACYNFIKSKGLDYPVIADDSGLFVNSLNGEPGVYSARYSGDHNDDGNNQKVLQNLADKKDRSAYFECDICYKDSKQELIFVGQTFGVIADKKYGKDTFGYDPIFYSNDLKKTFGEATAEEKDSVSHRGRAVEKLKIFLNNQQDKNAE